MSGDGQSQWVTLYKTSDGLDSLADQVNADIVAFSDREVESVALTSVAGIGPVLCVLWKKEEWG